MVRQSDSISGDGIRSRKDEAVGNFGEKKQYRRVKQEFPQNRHKRPRCKAGVRQVYVTKLLGAQVSVGDGKEERGESPELRE